MLEKLINRILITPLFSLTFFSPLNWQNQVIGSYSVCESVSTEYISWLIYELLENMVYNEIPTGP